MAANLLPSRVPLHHAARVSPLGVVAGNGLVTTLHLRKGIQLVTTASALPGTAPSNSFYFINVVVEYGLDMHVPLVNRNAFYCNEARWPKTPNCKWVVIEEGGVFLLTLEVGPDAVAPGTELLVCYNGTCTEVERDEEPPMPHL